MYFPIRSVLELFVPNASFVTEFFDITSQSRPVLSRGCRRQSGPVLSCVADKRLGEEGMLGASTS